MGAVLYDVAERFNGDPEVWFAKSAAFVLYSYYHLQESNRRRLFHERLQRLDGAWLGAIGTHDPGRLNDEQQRHLMSGSRSEATDLTLKRGLKMIEELEAGRYLVS